MRALLPLLLVCALAAGEDSIASLRFIDGRARTAADFADRSLVMVFFSGHCPTARAFMTEQAPALEGLIREGRQPVRLILATPDKDVAELTAWAKQRGFRDAFIASDPANSRSISLQNILQASFRRPDGKRASLGFGAAAVERLQALLAEGSLGAFTYPVEGLTNPVVQSLWWDVELGKPGAVKTLLAGQQQAKRDPAAKAQVDAVVAKVQEVAARCQDEAVAAAPSLAAYEALEAHATAYDGLDTAPARERLKALARDPALKDELAARGAYLKCQALLASKKPSEQKAGRDGLAEIARRYPATAYGQRAAGK